MTRSFADILRSALARVPEAMDKREGSVIYDALAPAAMELANLYAQLQYVADQAFADTADRVNLTRRAAERGYRPYPATKAVLQGEFIPNVPVGARFNLDDLNYVVLRHIEGTRYQVECETAGAAGNRRLGTLLPVGHVAGLESAALTAVLIPGEDAEETEAFRARYLRGFDSQAFGGNIADYQEKIGAIAGVGGVKVHPVRNGGGTVTVVILSSAHDVPSATLIETVQTLVDPPPQGMGVGLAPIDHIVHIAAAEAVPVDISVALEYQPGYAWASVADAVNDAIEQYFTALRATWADTDSLIVRISQIETRLLDIAGIVDVRDTTLGGAAGNLALTGDQVPVLGGIHETKH